MAEALPSLWPCRCSVSVRDGLLVVIMLISSHKSLAEQLVACGISAVLKSCIQAPKAETMLAIIARNHISMVHKLERKGMAEPPSFCNPLHPKFCNPPHPEPCDPLPSP